MTCSPDDLESFWSARWSVPLRSACRWLSPEEQTRADSDASAPRWLRPLCVQRWVGQAVRDRLAWMQAHPDAAFYRYSGSSDESEPSIPCWTSQATIPYDRQTLREVTEASLRWGWGVEVERLLRVSEAPPQLVGQATWTRAVLGVCLHLSQIYAELKRRHTAKQARALLREALRAYVEWDYRSAA